MMEQRISNKQIFDYCLVKVQNLDFDLLDLYKVFTICSVLKTFLRERWFIEDLIYYDMKQYDNIKRFDVSNVFVMVERELKKANNKYTFDYVFLFILFAFMMQATDFYEVSFASFVKSSKSNNWNYIITQEGDILIRLKQIEEH